VRGDRSRWFWLVALGLILLAGLGIWGLYAWLPADGASGGLESFTPEGFRIQWLLEERANGLRVGDRILRAGGHTADEWLGGAPRGPEWRAGGTIAYQIVRDGEEIALPVRLDPIPLQAILARWWAQLLASVALLAMGGFVLWKRPRELQARLLMLFCLTVAVQLWSDAYNFQFALLPWSWAFGYHLTVEHLTFSISYASICHFALIFPRPHPLVVRFPRLVPLVLYLANPVVIALTTALSPAPSRGLSTGNQASLIVAVFQLGLALVAGFRSLRTARDPVSHAQMRWILWGVGVAFAVALPGYIVPLALVGRPLIPNPVVMLLTVLIPYVYGVAVLRYRLFDIEVIINRTLVYGSLTVLLAGLYVLVVRLLTWLIEALFQSHDDVLVIFVAAVSIALAFDPLRRRVQALIDRTFYRTKLDVQRLLAEMSERLVTSVLLDDLAAPLTRELPERLQIAWARLSVFDPEGERLLPVAGGADDAALPAGHPLIRFLHAFGEPLHRLQPPSRLPDAARAFLDEQAIELIIPLIVRGELVGLYSLGPKLSGSAYTRDEMRLLHLLGQQAAIAVENSRLFQAERQQRSLAEALQGAADAVSSTLDLDQVLDRILEQVERVVEGDAFNIMLVEAGLARVARWRGYQELGVAERIAGFSAPVADYPTLAQMIRTGKPVIVSDAATDPNWVSLAGWEWLGSYLSAPIRVGGQTVGLLNVDRTQPGRFSPADAQRLEAFAQHAATALQNARLYAETQRQLREQTALRQAGAVISSSLDSEMVLMRIAEEMGHAVDATSAYLCSVEPATLIARVRAEYVSPQARPAERESGLGVEYSGEGKAGWLAKMVAGQHDIAHADSPGITPDEQEHMQRYGVQTILSIPLRTKGEFVGYAELWESRQRREFTPQEIALCQDMAQQAAIALEHARLYEQAQQEIAERRRAEEQIKASLQEKEMLLREIHHRVKNNLQVISGLLFLQSQQIQEPEALRMFQDSQHRVRSMALVHERLYRTQDLARVDFAQYIRDLAGYLLRSYGVAPDLVSMNIDVRDVSLGIDVAVPCGLIVSELISNALTHAFPGGRAGEILIEMRTGPGGQCTLVVGDDGVGLPQGLDLENTGTLGLRLVSRLANQLGATVELDGNMGTRFQITFTAQEYREVDDGEGSDTDR
jgi:two-component sensor histidine kinase